MANSRSDNGNVHGQFREVGFGMCVDDALRRRRTVVEDGAARLPENMYADA
jgi:hypothetical protein